MSYIISELLHKFLDFWISFLRRMKMAAGKRIIDNRNTESSSSDDIIYGMRLEKIQTLLTQNIISAK